MNDAANGFFNKLPPLIEISYASPVFGTMRRRLSGEWKAPAAISFFPPVEVVEFRLTWSVLAS